MIDAPPPTSEPSPTTTPCEMRPSTIEAPSVPALKLTKPSCMHRRAGREVRAEAHARGVGDAHAVGHDVVEQPRELVDAVRRDAGALQGRAQAREVVGVHRAGGRPGDDRQVGEDAVEVDRVRRDEQVAQQVQAQVGVGGGGRGRHPGRWRR